MANSGLNRRLTRTLLLQVGFITVATVFGILTAKFVLEDVLIRQALVGEAQHFWSKRSFDPAFPLPDTQNMTGYMTAPPQELVGLGAGFYKPSEGENRLVLVSERDGNKLYLVYDARRVNELAFIFGLLPLALVLLVLYLSSWLGFRASRRAISPVIALARRVQEIDLQHPDPAAFDVVEFGDGLDDEINVLANAMQRFTRRLNDFIVRETYFTRDASHELRSPLTVIQMAAEILSANPALNDAGHRAVDRIQRSARDMEELIGAFLLLAREAESGLPSERVSINAVVMQELQHAQAVSPNREVKAEIVEHCSLAIDAPEKVLSVMIGNLLRNAFSYTDEGQVTITVDPRRVTIADSGIGMTADQLQRVYEPFVRGNSQTRGGYGVGLTIVRRLSDRFAWPVAIDSEPGVGTTVSIHFPDAQLVTADQS